VAKGYIKKVLGIMNHSRNFIKISSKFHQNFIKISSLTCHFPVGEKLREEIEFLQTGHFQPRAVPCRLDDLRPLPKNLLYEVESVLKISSRSFHSIKSYSTF
jgi:hypothetical protein